MDIVGLINSLEFWIFTHIETPTEILIVIIIYWKTRIQSPQGASVGWFNQHSMSCHILNKEDQKASQPNIKHSLKNISNTSITQNTRIGRNSLKVSFIYCHKKIDIFRNMDKIVISFDVIPIQKIRC